MDDLESMGLSARELKKLKALMEREAEDERRKSGSTKSRRRAPLLLSLIHISEPTRPY